MVKVRTLRHWGQGAIIYPPGRVIEVPAAVANRMERASPPFAERVKESAPVVKREPKKDDGEG